MFLSLERPCKNFVGVGLLGVWVFGCLGVWVCGIGEFRFWGCLDFCMFWVWEFWVWGVWVFGVLGLVVGIVNVLHV